MYSTYLVVVFVAAKEGARTHGPESGDHKLWWEQLVCVVGNSEMVDLQKVETAKHREARESAGCVVVWLGLASLRQAARAGATCR